MLWRVLSFDLTNVIFAACFTLRGHDTHIDFLWVLFLVGRIGPLAPVVQKLESAIHRINHYQVDSAIIFPNTYRLDSNLSGG